MNPPVFSCQSSNPQASSREPPRPVPSAQECRFCDISAADCPERVDEPTLHQGETLDF